MMNLAAPRSGSLARASIDTTLLTAALMLVTMLPSAVFATG